MIFCGIDWAEGHHDIALVDQDGSQPAKLRISDDSDGFHALLELLARHGDTAYDAGQAFATSLALAA